MKLCAILFLLPVVLLSACANAEQKTVVVYKSPTCGCCTKWVAHMEQNGFKVESHNVQDVSPYKKQYGIAKSLASCHTALVGGYVIEGHVPASDILRLLREKKDIKGLAVPAMPVGTPGMEMGNRKDKYNVIAIHKDNTTSIWSSY